VTRTSESRQGELQELCRVGTEWWPAGEPVRNRSDFQLTKQTDYMHSGFRKVTDTPGLLSFPFPLCLMLCNKQMHLCLFHKKWTLHLWVWRPNRDRQARVLRGTWE
jgi:hypothetical protein